MTDQGLKMVGWGSDHDGSAWVWVGPVHLHFAPWMLVEINVGRLTLGVLPRAQCHDPGSTAEGWFWGVRRHPIGGVVGFGRLASLEWITSEFKDDIDEAITRMGDTCRLQGGHR